jgi:hypothetical protein
MVFLKQAADTKLLLCAMRKNSWAMKKPQRAQRNSENSVDEKNNFLAEVMKICLVQARVVRSSRQERQDCAKIAKYR